MSLSSDEYKKMGEKAVPKTKCLRNLTGAFLIGGTICVLGQFLLNFYLDMGLSTPAASTACSITLVGISAVLTGIGVYDKIAKFGGGGTLVPITGFANAVASPAIDARSEGYILGVGAKIFTVSGPVILYGTLAGTIYGVIYWILSLF